MTKRVKYRLIAHVEMIVEIDDGFLPESGLKIEVSNTRHEGLPVVEVEAWSLQSAERLS